MPAPAVRAGPADETTTCGTESGTCSASVAAVPVSPQLSRAVGLLVGVGLDAAVGDPRRGHPVAGFGRYAGWVERASYRDDRAAGAVHLLACVGPVLLWGVAAERATARRPAARVLATAIATWAVLGARSLAAEGAAMAGELAAGERRGDLAAARDRLPHLCGRDPAGLDAAELGRATVESLAENASDAVVCSLFWGAAFGVPGLLGHRAVNTLDAMVGHRSARYARFGTASARCDDLLGLLPARLTGVLACALAPLVGGSTRSAWRVLRADHGAHPSPNGGWPESAWAGALGVRLGGVNVYTGRVEERPVLGAAGRTVAVADVRRAARLVGLVTGACALLAAGSCLIRGATWSKASLILRRG